MNEVTATLILSHTPFLGPVKIRALISQFGSAEHVLRNISFLKLRAESLQYLYNYDKEKSWQEDLQLASKQGVTLLPFTDPCFPERMKELADCPPLLYILGTLPSFSVPWVAIVGTRTSTPYANEMAERFGRELAYNGAVVVSGLARGVDTYAHKGAIAQTVAVIGSGLSHIYPTENVQLAKKIAENGCVISEFPMNTTPTKFTFPKRNRLIAALGSASLLIEAPMKSGAMITMQDALQQNKKLFAIPQKAGSEYAAGNHFLIKKGHAQLVDHPLEILEALSWKQKTAQKNCTSHSFTNDFEKKICEILQTSESTLEELSERISLPIQTLQGHLTFLQIKKIILELPGKRYRLFT